MRRTRSTLVAGLLALAGCQQDPCDEYSGQTCITLAVDESGDERSEFEQLRVTSVELGINQVVTPRSPTRFSMPVEVALLPAPGFSGGSFTVSVEAKQAGVDFHVGGQASGTVEPPGHVRVSITLPWGWRGGW